MVIDESHTIESIGEGAFYGCISLTSISIPESVTSIGDMAFSGCSSLTSILWNGNTYTDVDSFLSDFREMSAEQGTDMAA